MKEIKLTMNDGVVLTASLWDDVEKPKGVIQICHGMSEYAGRYDEFAQYCNKRGYIAFADDHRAHGRTETDKDRGGHKGFIFKKSLSDEVEIYNHLKKTYGLPIYFFGHSYGSFLGQGFLQQKTDVKAVALAGTAYMPTALVLIGTIILSPIALLFGKCRPSFINKGSDLLYNERYKGETGASLWVTSDPVKRQEFIDDPMCGVHMSINFCYSMIKGILSVNNADNCAKINCDTPIGIFCGTEDPIGGYGKKAEALKKHYKKLGVKKVILNLYEGARHEVVNDKCRDKSFPDIIDFFESVE